MSDSGDGIRVYMVPVKLNRFQSFMWAFSRQCCRLNHIEALGGIFPYRWTCGMWDRWGDG